MYCMHVCAVCSSVWVLQCGVCFSVALLSPLNFLWFVLAIRIMVLFRMIMARSRSRLRLRARPHHRPAEASHSNWWRPIRLALPQPQHRTVCSSWFLGFEATEGQYSSSCNMLQYHQTLSYNLNFYMFYRSTSLVLHRINIWYLICTYRDKINGISRLNFCSDISVQFGIYYHNLVCIPPTPNLCIASSLCLLPPLTPPLYTCDLKTCTDTSWSF